MNVEPPELYKHYHIDRDDERVGLFSVLASTFLIQSALYPGSFVHIAPSIVIPKVVYVDSYKKAKPVFDDPSTIAYLKTRKTYEQDAHVRFMHASFTDDLALPEESFDLLISQYAGLVSYHCRRYLRVGGVLVANNSHGDASMAFLDPCYQFIGVVNKRDNQFRLTDTELDKYFIPKNRAQVTKEELLTTTKGIGYTKSAGNYLFRKISQVVGSCNETSGFTDEV